MANPERGEVDLVIGEQTYVLRITTNELCAMEKRTGQSYGQILGGVMALNMTATRDYLRTVLEPAHGRDLRLAAQKAKTDVDTIVANLIDAATFKHVKETLIALFTLNMPPAEEAATTEEPNPPDAQGGTGDSSTSAPAVSA